MVDALTSVFFAVRREDIQNLGILERRRLMFDVPCNQEAVSRFCLEHPSGMLKTNTTADDVDHLLVRVAVPDADPTLLHPVPHQHHGGTV